MNCPKCKNPISDNSQECEWCGFKIITKSMEKIDDVDEAEFDGNIDVEENKSDYWSYLILPALCLLGFLLAKISNLIS